VKLLLDTCVWGGVVDALKSKGHDVVWAGDWPADPGDEEILALAYQEGRILITLDKDFGELAVVREQAHAGIIRLVVLSASQQAPTCLRVLQRYGTELQSGAIVTVERGRIRVRPSASQPESS
jgi:predicted nuclease of predicted toxin-antitoxin system